MKRKFYLFDAKVEILGRLAVRVANVLSGREKPDFSPNIDGGDAVVVVNSDNVLVSGKKKTGKLYHSFSGYPGGIKSLTLEEVIVRDSRKVIKGAVYGMLPKNKLRDKMMKRLKVYKNDDHPHQISKEVSQF